jgi:hypothetical protein
MSSGKLVDGKLSLQGGGFFDHETILVAACCTDEKGQAVSITVVRSWPNRVQKWAFAKVQELTGGLVETADERKLLDQALAQEGSPISSETLYKFICSLDEKVYSSLRKWLIPDGEVEAKNALSDITSG